MPSIHPKRPSAINPTRPSAINNVLFLGANGRIGKLIRPFLSQHPALWHARVPFKDTHGVDILNDPKGLEALMAQADTVVCLAGITPAQDANMALNVDLARATMNAAQKAQVGRIILTSSGAVYGKGCGPWSEDGPTAPFAAYGASKLDMEHMAAAHPMADKTSCLRIGNVAGADAILGKWHADMMLDQLDNGRAPRRSYIGPHTLAQTLWTLATGNMPPFLLNIAAPGTICMDALLDAAHLPFGYRTPHAGVTADVNLCTKRLETLMTFTPEDSTAQSMVAQWRESTGAL